ncbi:MAG: YhgE/Pip domain-containing protein [Clostridia bacterium]|nr:YhgE/Pip domain-containing protein [Clostridia bacterium]
MNSKRIMKIVIFAVVMMIPIIYSFFYLKSYWDPYGNLQDMKVAIVNLDKGYNGENQGEKIVSGLRGKNVVNICEVNENEAKEGLENNKYYAVITIPEDFTKDLNSAGEVDKKVVKITYSPNQKMNYLGSQIINRVVTATEEQIKSEVAGKTVERLSKSLKVVPENLQKISDGSNEILSGTQNLSNGLGELNNGVNTLKNSYSEFDDGLESAANGSKKLNSGITQIDSGAQALAQGGNTLNSAINQINDGADMLLQSGNSGIVKLQEGIAQVDAGSESLNAGVKKYVDNSDYLGKSTIAYIDGVNGLNENTKALLTAMAQYGEVSQDPNVKAMSQNAKMILASGAYDKIEQNGNAIKNGEQQFMKYGPELKKGSQDLANGANLLNQNASALNKITTGMTDLKNGLSQVQSGTNNLNSGINKLEDGARSVKSGSESLAIGLESLSTNSDKIKNALVTLSDGTNKAYNGSIELQNGVQTLKNGVDEGIETANKEMTKLDGLSEHVSNPVEVEQKNYGEVSTYGIAFTPLFLSIGLWVGALMCYVVLYYDQKHRFGIFDSEYKNKLLQDFAYLFVGVIQGLVTAFLLKLTLGYNVDNIAVYYGVSMLMGICFTAIIQFLIRTFGDVGKFLALIILVLQLAASGGTFPVDTIAKGFRWLNPLLPMTYTINILKDCLISTNVNFIGHNCLIIAIYILICVIMTIVIELVRKRISHNS